MLFFFGGGGGVPAPYLGLLEAGRAVLVHHRQPVGAGEVTRLRLARVDQGADDPDAALALVVRLHGAGLCVWGVVLCCDVKGGGGFGDRICFGWGLGWFGVGVGDSGFGVWHGTARRGAKQAMAMRCGATSHLSVVHEGHEEGLHAVVEVLRQDQLVVPVGGRCVGCVVCSVRFRSVFVTRQAYREGKKVQAINTNLLSAHRHPHPTFLLVLLAAGVEEAALHPRAEGAQRVPDHLRLCVCVFFQGSVGDLF